MIRVKTIAAAGALAVLALCAANVGAQGANTREVTYLTFSHPVELPGVRLEPGTYEFRMADLFQKEVIQVFRKDNTKEVIGQWTFVQAERPRVSNETVVMFRETAEGSTPAVQYWYYPGETVGKEFIYPKDQAERIAARTGQRVRSEDGYVTAPARAGAEAGSSGAVGTSGDRTATPAVGTTGDGEPAAGEPDEPDAEPIADPDDQIGQSDAPDARFDAGVDARADSGSPGLEAEVDADVASRVSADPADDDNAAASNSPSVFAQPSAPAGSTTGIPAERASAQVDVQLEPEEPDAADDAPGANEQIANRQVADPDRPQPVGTSGSSQVQEAEGAVERPGELPRTASPLALTGILGLLSLSAAAGLRLFR